jgi:CBS domain-containing protein
MNVEQLMTKNGAACLPGATLNEVAQIMWDGDCGFVPVVESHARPRLVGVITDRDVCMAAYTRGASLKDLCAADAMTADFAVCGPADALSHAVLRMAEARVRRLPVADEAGQLIGVISISDIAREAARQRRRRSKREITQAEVGSLLAAISEPHKVSAPSA